MKTKIILTTLFALFIFSANNAYTSEPQANRLTNEIETEYGKKIETTYFVGGTNYADRKWTSKVDKEGRYLERILYSWNSFRGWQEQTKITYTYNSDQQLTSMSRTEWNSRKKDWEKDSKTINYTYNKNGFQNASLTASNNK